MRWCWLVYQYAVFVLCGAKIQICSIRFYCVLSVCLRLGALFFQHSFSFLFLHVFGGFDVLQACRNMLACAMCLVCIVMYCIRWVRFTYSFNTNDICESKILSYILVFHLFFSAAATIDVRHRCEHHHRNQLLQLLLLTISLSISQ